MDLASISMKDLADRLGVGVATLYRYVSDRTELVRLASARAAHRTFPRDTGQPWPELLTGYAESIYSALSVSPMLLHAYVDGHIGPELEIEFADSFLAAMKKRGFVCGCASKVRSIRRYSAPCWMRPPDDHGRSDRPYLPVLRRDRHAARDRQSGPDGAGGARS